MGVLSVYILLILIKILAIQVGLGDCVLCKLLIILYTYILLGENTPLAYHGSR